MVQRLFLFPFAVIVSRMSITVELPPEIEAQVRAIPDLSQRVISFLRDQAAHESWRQQRYSEKARLLVQQSLQDGEAMKTDGISRDEMFRRLFEVQHEIDPQR
jgi:hypothetical protein